MSRIDFKNMGSKNDFLETQNTFFFSGSGENIKNIPDWLIKANFSRTQTDLILNFKNEKIFLIDYFRHHDLPSIITKNGLLMRGETIEKLSGNLSQNDFVQSGEINLNVTSIGEVSAIKGKAISIRADGSKVELSKGELVFQGDIIETSIDSSLGLIFLDKTTLALSESGKMILDELVYDPNLGNGSMAIDMVEGAFSFVSGEIAKISSDSMSVKTPVATIGIRGTTVAGKASLEGNENTFTLLKDDDGSVGVISVSNAAGTQTLSQLGETTNISSFNIAPPSPIILSEAEILENYGSALEILPITPEQAPKPKTVEENEREQEINEQNINVEEENNDEDSDELNDQIIEEEGNLEEQTESIDEVIDNNELELIDENIQTESNVEIEEEFENSQEVYEAAIADGASPDEAMAEAAANSEIETNSVDQKTNTDQGINSPNSFQFNQQSENINYNFSSNSVFETNEMSDSLVIENSYNGQVLSPIGFEITTNSTDYLNEFNSEIENSVEEIIYEDASLYDDTNQSSETSNENSTSSGDTITGTSNSDELIGTSNDESIYGLALNDLIYGFAGNDTLVGGLGNDTIYGGGGNDSFYYTNSSEGPDKILDFGINDATKGNDKIEYAGSFTHSHYSRSGFQNIDYNNSYGNIEYTDEPNVLPIGFNFTVNYDNIPNQDWASATTLDLHSNFYVFGDNYADSISEFLLITGDGTDSAVWLWEDTDKDGQFQGDDSNEMSLVAILYDVDNDNLTGDNFASA